MENDDDDCGDILITGELFGAAYFQTPLRHIYPDCRERKEVVKELRAAAGE